MSSKHDGHLKKRQICACMGWPYHEYESKIISFYAQEYSANDIAVMINLKLPKHVSITARSIQRTIKKTAEKTNNINILRSSAAGFKLKVKKGEVKWAYKTIKARKNNIGSAKRYAILSRDSFKCVLCGATAQDDLLEVDHVTPICAGGSDEPDNLRTLCNQCNAGKKIFNKEV